ncbi:hypothetical protein T310_10125, partial [Rasamsonia emersonii CBS 393.64]
EVLGGCGVQGHQSYINESLERIANMFKHKVFDVTIQLTCCHVSGGEGGEAYVRQNTDTKPPCKRPGSLLLLLSSQPSLLYFRSLLAIRNCSIAWNWIRHIFLRFINEELWSLHRM